MILKIAVVISFVIAIASLVYMVVRTFAFGSPSHYAKARGASRRGIQYAMGRGMMPWEKESAGRHLLTYAAGILYHTGVFMAVIYLFLIILNVGLPAWFDPILQGIFGVSLFCGISLLIKRYAVTKMRSISCIDDYVANILVDGFLALALIHTLAPGLISFLYIWSVLLFLYMPVGKIRHCFFFFYVRILFGIFFGRRNVFPPQKKVV